MALPQPCPQAFPSWWGAGEAGAAFSGTKSAAPGTAALPPRVASFSPRRRPSPGSPVRGFVVTRRPAAVRGCGCRSRAARQATIGRRRARHAHGRARPSRWAGHERATPVVARAVRRDVSVVARPFLSALRADHMPVGPRLDLHFNLEGSLGGCDQSFPLVDKRLERLDVIENTLETHPAMAPEKGLLEQPLLLPNSAAGCISFSPWSARQGGASRRRNAAACRMPPQSGGRSHVHAAGRSVRSLLKASASRRLPQADACAMAHKPRGPGQSHAAKVGLSTHTFCRRPFSHEPASGRARGLAGAVRDRRATPRERLSRLAPRAHTDTKECVDRSPSSTSQAGSRCRRSWSCSRQT